MNIFVALSIEASSHDTSIIEVQFVFLPQSAEAAASVNCLCAFMETTVMATPNYLSQLYCVSVQWRRRYSFIQLLTLRLISVH